MRSLPMNYQILQMGNMKAKEIRRYMLLAIGTGVILVDPEYFHYHTIDRNHQWSNHQEKHSKSSLLTVSGLADKWECVYHSKLLWNGSHGRTWSRFALARRSFHSFTALFIYSSWLSYYCYLLITPIMLLRNEVLWSGPYRCAGFAIVQPFSLSLNNSGKKHVRRNSYYRSASINNHTCTTIEDTMTVSSQLSNIIFTIAIDNTDQESRHRIIAVLFVRLMFVPTINTCYSQRLLSCLCPILSSTILHAL